MNQPTNALEPLLYFWKSDPETAANIAFWKKIPPHPAETSGLPSQLHPALEYSLRKAGYDKLYSHQADSWRLLQAGKNLVIVTGTSSGKTLCYNLSILDTLTKDPAARALYIFPTKALAQDQLKKVQAISDHIPNNPLTAVVPKITAAIYDGDTPTGQRNAIRAQARLLLTNPDM